MFDPAFPDDNNLIRLQQGTITESDFYFARYLAVQSKITSPKLVGLFADLSHALTQQHSCLDLGNYPDNENLVKLLAATNCVSALTIGNTTSDNSPTPLVLEGKLLFLHKYFQYECRIAGRLLAQNRPRSNVDLDQLSRLIHQHSQLQKPKSSEPTDSLDIDWQVVATFQALTNNLTIITGGPGTGKTTTVYKILKIWAALESSIRGHEVTSGEIKLAAPTGKAAMRLSESLLLSEKLNLSNDDMAMGRPDLPISQVVTIHRLLGYRPQNNSYRHNASNPLRAKLLVIDEVSMLDLAMLDRLLAATPADCQLILIGDPNQLPSVDAGNVLMDICKLPAPYTETFAADLKKYLAVSVPYNNSDHGLSNSICTLTKSHRFSTIKGVGRAAASILAGKPIEQDSDIHLHELAGPLVAYSLLFDSLSDYLDAVNTPETSPEELITLFEASRILCPVRDSSMGVEAINRAIELRLDKADSRLGGRSLEPTTSALTDANNYGHDNYYHGRPLMILQNDYNLSLFNGDIGICVNETESNNEGVAFRNNTGDIEIIPIARLPKHETCFAMTIHKAQGSEFDHVSLVLGADLSQAQEGLITRELLYTAVTRSRKSVTIYSQAKTLQNALHRRIKRASGLGDRLLLTEKR